MATQCKAINLLGYQLKPNLMQLNFIRNLQDLRKAGENRALLISTTGAHVILMRGRKAFKINDFESSFSIL